mgnify:FL=1|jgi:hypothetical protein|tara:strand:- start:1416 stop:1652 length:237 start_codon:yes stop_codon:yes gene_type:complete
MRNFKDFVPLTPQEKQLMEEAIRQFKDVTKDAEDLASKMRKKIFIMQHASTGKYEFASNRNEIRRLERKGFEIVDEVE